MVFLGSYLLISYGWQQLLPHEDSPKQFGNLGYWPQNMIFYMEMWGLVVLPLLPFAIYLRRSSTARIETGAGASETGNDSSSAASFPRLAAELTSIVILAFLLLTFS